MTRTYKKSKYSEKFCNCGIFRAGKQVLINFEYRGMQVKTKKSGLECRVCCMKNWVANFEEKAKDMILVSDKKIFIDWEKYFEKQDIDKEIINYILYEIGILDYIHRGGYAIISGDSIFNPSISGSPMLFCDKEEFKNFVKIGFKNSVYSWITVKIEKEFTKQEFLFRKGI